MNKLLPPKKSENLPLAKTSEIDYLLEIVREIIKAEKAGFTIHALMLASSVIEESLLPQLTEMVLSRLGMLDKKDILSADSFAIKNDLYFALTQDFDLYIKLEKFRKIRNNVTHEIFSYHNSNKIKIDAKLGLKQFKNIVGEISNRLNGRVPIPILTYYPKGWNEAINEVLKLLK